MTKDINQQFLQLETTYNFNYTKAIAYYMRQIGSLINSTWDHLKLPRSLDYSHTNKVYPKHGKYIHSFY